LQNIILFYILKYLGMKGNSLFNEPYLTGLRPKAFMGKTKEIYTKKALLSGNGKTYNKSFGKKKVNL